MAVEGKTLSVVDATSSSGREAKVKVSNSCCCSSYQSRPRSGRWNVSRGTPVPMDRLKSLGSHTHIICIRSRPVCLLLSGFTALFSLMLIHHSSVHRIKHSISLSLQECPRRPPVSEGPNQTNCSDSQFASSTRE